MKACQCRFCQGIKRKEEIFATIKYSASNEVYICNECSELIFEAMRQRKRNLKGDKK